MRVKWVKIKWGEYFYCIYVYSVCVGKYKVVWIYEGGGGGFWNNFVMWIFWYDLCMDLYRFLLFLKLIVSLVFFLGFVMEIMNLIGRLKLR